VVQQPKTYLVTGATSGIGEAVTAALLTTRGARVVGVARTAERARAATDRLRRRLPDAEIDYLTANLSEMAQVRRLAAQLCARVSRVDGLILNAGVARPRRELTADGFEMDFATNHLSAFLLVRELDDLLRASAPARVVAVSSSAQMHVKAVDLDAMVTGNGFHHLRTYSATKLLTVLFTNELSRRLAGSGVSANSADPGFVRTRLGRDAPGAFGMFLKLARPFQLSPAKAAVTPVFLATSPEVDGVTGGYFAKCRPARTGDLAQDPVVAERLWELSTELVAGPHRSRAG